MQLSTVAVKELRERSGAGIIECKRALEGAGGDVERALEVLRCQGLAKAERRAQRETRQGLVETYLHGAGRIGAMVELNCESDFVARTEEFRSLAHNLAMQIAATSPLFLSAEEVPEGQPADPTEVCLLEQPFIKDPGKSVRDLLNETIGRTGENVRVRRFARFELGAE